MGETRCQVDHELLLIKRSVEAQKVMTILEEDVARGDAAAKDQEQLLVYVATNLELQFVALKEAIVSELKVIADALSESKLLAKQTVTGNRQIITEMRAHAAISGQIFELLKAKTTAAAANNAEVLASARDHLRRRYIQDVASFLSNYDAASKPDRQKTRSFSTALRYSRAVEWRRLTNPGTIYLTFCRLLCLG